jgi:hypothetical protein
MSLYPFFHAVFWHEQNFTKTQQQQQISFVSTLLAKNLLKSANSIFFVLQAF